MGGGGGVSGWIARKNRVRTKENRKSEPANQTEIAERETEYKGEFVCWLLNVPATCECISGTDLLRQFYVLPH